MNAFTLPGAHNSLSSQSFFCLETTFIRHLMCAKHCARHFRKIQNYRITRCWVQSMDEEVIVRITELLWGHRWEQQSVIRTPGSMKPESEFSFMSLFFFSVVSVLTLM